MRHNPMRRIKKAKITHLSLVPRGANRLPVIYKEDKSADNLDIDLLVKESKNFDEKGELLAVVYAPELRDTQGDIAGADVIREAMHASAKDGLKIDMRHDGKELTKEQVYVAESFEIQQGDPRFKDFKDRDGRDVDVAGGWGVVLKIDDPAVRKLYREKKWGGVSMMGDGVVVVEKEDDAVDRILGKLEARLNKQSTGDEDMKPEELEAALNKAIKPVADRLEKLEKGEQPADDKGGKGADADELLRPILKSDMSREEMQQYRFDLRRYNILKSVKDAEKTGDDKKITAALTKADTDLEALEADIEKAAGGEEGDGKKGKGKTAKTADGKTAPSHLSKEQQEEWLDMQERLAVLEKSSNQRGGSDEEAEDTGLSKEDNDAVAAARKVATARNTRLFGQKK